MDRPDAVGHCRRQCGVSSPAQGRRAGAPGCGAPWSGAGRATGRSIRGHRAGHFAGGPSEAAHLGRQRPVCPMAVCDRPQQADRCVAPPRPAHFRRYRRFRRDAAGRGAGRDRLGERGCGPASDAAGAAARRVAVDRGRQRLNQGYGREIFDERGSGAGGAAPGVGQPDGEATGTVRMDTDQLIRTLAADNPHRARPVGFALMLALLTAGIGGEMMMPQRLPMMTRLVGKNSWVCMTAIPLMSLPILAGALIGLRHGAPARPAVAGAIAGLLSAGLAATLYASHCTDDSPLFVATWYTIATALVTAIGALAGSRILRF